MSKSGTQSNKNRFVSFIAETIATGFGSGRWPFVAPADHDPARGVIDEWVGMWITVLFLPVTWSWMLAGFLLFRVLDIYKPLGVRKIEACPGGWGIMFDDIAAGVIGFILLNGVRLAFFN